ncbi:hypothetical protein B1813_01415 [Saccharomonospora piscinae]|uniref:Uncharacterized protein n=1 Tax=Saccharomonospora piscinae TaxID=687388 RepID=A0A1V9ADH7_SACPI|nr:hypothetical protein [Saccharomonospora piscinae]OQO95140.1 hypothetical protein B1813_01415 [Saccharomonospora piscinae]TLW94514.1 hypothetical protein FFT09_01040 [Saccharomonospora piscinae]
MLGVDSADLVLATYLNDHHAAALGGAELARRLASQQRNSPHAAELAGIAEELAADLGTVRRIMGELDVPVRAYKATAAWAAEKVGRLKFNGRVLASSPSSPVLELEGLAMQVTLKSALWHSLRARAARDGRLDPDELDELLARAEAQAATVWRLHGRFADAAFT